VYLSLERVGGDYLSALSMRWRKDCEREGRRSPKRRNEETSAGIKDEKRFLVSGARSRSWGGPWGSLSPRATPRKGRNMDGTRRADTIRGHTPGLEGRARSIPEVRLLVMVKKLLFRFKTKCSRGGRAKHRRGRRRKDTN